MNKRTKIFIDFEFTGLRKATTQISLGMISENGKKFYAEFNDYDKSQCDEFLNDNVLPKLRYTDYHQFVKNNEEDNFFEIKDDKGGISNAVKMWLSQFNKIEFWGDSITYDWWLFLDLYYMGEDYDKTPKNFHSYQCFDLFTALYVIGKGDYLHKKPRKVLLDLEHDSAQHNALYDAEICMKVYNKFFNN